MSACTCVFKYVGAQVTVHLCVVMWELMRAVLSPFLNRPTIHKALRKKTGWDSGLLCVCARAHAFCSDKLHICFGFQ